MSPLLALLLACSDGKDPVDSDPQAADDTAAADDSGDTGQGEALPPGVYPVDGIDVTLPPDDLAPLGDIVGDAEWVALGESIHTSGGYYQAKFRLFKTLVEEHGFRVYGFESPWEDAMAANAYVRTCEGDPVDALHSLFGVWWDESVLETLEWMCEWNTAHPDDPVHFFGWDIQQGWDDGRLLREYLEDAAPGDAEALYAGIDHCMGVGYEDASAFYNSEEGQFLSNGGSPDADIHAACLTGIEALQSFLDENAAALVDASGQEALDWAWISLVSLEAWELELWHYNSDQVASYEVRDVGNTYVIQEMRRLMFPDEKVVIWAHNAHIAAAHHELHGYGRETDRYPHFQGWRSMGTFLEEQLGEDYVPIGLIGYDVDINWGYPDPELPRHPQAAEVMLHELGRDALLVDLNATGGLFEPGVDYQITMEWQVPAEQYDALFYLDYSYPMTYVY